MKTITTLAALTVCTLVLAGCSSSKSSKPSAVTQKPDTVTKEDVLKTNADIAFAAFGDAHTSAITLKDTLSDLVTTPSSETHMAAKQAWLAAREPYGQTEVYRFRDGPIDALKEDGTLAAEGGPEGRINAWPLGEAVIDYVSEVDGDTQPANSTSTNNVTDGNIIAMYAGDTELAAISAADLKNGLVEGLDTDERNVITGYHAIEFLLWGQDLNTDGSGSNDRDTTPGNRPWTDYDTSTGNCTSGIEAPATSELICTRRGEFLLAAADLLIEDLARVANAWDPDIAESYYNSFIAGADTSLGKILGGMGRLSYGELAGERINIALLEDSQEDEHSCFSDNTHRDIYLNAKGVQNTFEGSYTRIDGSKIEGAGISALLASQGATDIRDKLQADLMDTMSKISTLDQAAKKGTPFDNQIQSAEHKPNITLAIEALLTQTSSIEEAIKALGITAADLRQDTEEFM